MLKYTVHTFNKLKDLLKEAGYQVRTGKGSFNTGYCLLETKKVVVINKYHSMEVKISALMDLIYAIKISPDILTPASLKLYETVLKENNKSLSDEEE